MNYDGGLWKLFVCWCTFAKGWLQINIETTITTVYSIQFVDLLFSLLNLLRMPLLRQVSSIKYTKCVHGRNEKLHLIHGILQRILRLYDGFIPHQIDQWKKTDRHVLMYIIYKSSRKKMLIIRSFNEHGWVVTNLCIKRNKYDIF